jgi:hypothetical protein
MCATSAPARMPHHPCSVPLAAPLYFRALFLVVISHFSFPDHPWSITWSCVRLSLGRTFLSRAAGYWSNILDISPRYAGTLLGISNTIATFAGVFANISTGAILGQSGGRHWDAVFGLAILVYVTGLGTYVTFAKGHAIF